MTINLNDKVIVNLTAYGRAIYGDYFGNYLADFEDTAIQADGSYEFQLWRLMRIFGKTCYNGNPRIPFVDNKITIKE